MTSSTKDWGVAEIQRFLADYTASLGEHFRPEHFMVFLGPSDDKAGIRVFRAVYGWSHHETGISGILINGEPPEMQTDVAIARLFDRWLAAGPSEATPARLAAAVEFLVDPMDLFQAILTEEDIARMDRPAWRELVHLPAAAEGGVERGIVYWRVSSSGVTEFHVTREASGEIITDERRVDQ